MGVNLPVVFFKARGWWGPAHGGDHRVQSPQNDGGGGGSNLPTMPSSANLSSLDQARAYWREHFGGKTLPLVVHSGGKKYPIKVRFWLDNDHAFTSDVGGRQKVGYRDFDPDRAQALDRLLQVISHPQRRLRDWDADLLLEKRVGNRHYTVVLKWESADTYRFSSAHFKTIEDVSRLFRRQNPTKNNGPLQKSEPLSAFPDASSPHGAGGLPFGVTSAALGSGRTSRHQDVAASSSINHRGGLRKIMDQNIGNDRFSKAYIHGHYRKNPKTGEMTWIESYSDQRQTRQGPTVFAHDLHRQDHVKHHLAAGRLREAMHGFHDLDHDGSHQLAESLGLHSGPQYADKKTLMQALHAKLHQEVVPDSRNYHFTPSPPDASMDGDAVMASAERHLGSESVFEIFDYLPDRKPDDLRWSSQEMYRAIFSLKAERRHSRHDKTKQALLAANDGSPLGLEIKKPDSNRHALILPDATQPGKYRYSAYDEGGFYTHSTHDTADKALDEAIKEGFTEHAPGSLDRLSQTEAWSQGMARAAEAQKGWKPMAKSILFITKSFVPAHTRKLASGKVVQVRAYNNRQFRHGEDGGTLDMFAGPEDTVSMSKKELIAEHEKLVAVLKSPDHADDLAEAKDQEKELKGYKKGTVIGFNKPTPALASSADGAILAGNRGGAPQAPAAGAKPMIDMTTPEMKTLAINLAATHYEALGRGRVGRGAFKQEFLDGQHEDLVAAAVAQQQTTQTKVKAAADTLTAPPGYTLTVGDKLITLKGPFDEDLNSRIKRLGGYWDGASRGNTKSWIIPAAKAASLKRVLGNYQKVAKQQVAAASAQEAATAALRTDAPAVKAGKYGPFMVSLQGANTYRVDFEYDRNAVAKIKGVAGAKYEPATRSWLIDRAQGAQLSAILEAAAAAVPVVPAVTQTITSPKADPPKLVTTYLNVPFAQKDEARLHGAKWDPAHRAWYVVGDVPEALHQFWAQRPMPAGHFRIGGGQGYGYRELHPGETIRNPKADGPQWVTVVDASKQYYREDGMSFGVGDESGYVFSATVRPATPEESAPHEQAEQARAYQQALKQRVSALADAFRQEGERPAAATVEGEKLLDTRTIYGGGAHWVIAPDAIWFVQGNGADGDNWAYNNVPGGIAWKMPRTPEAEQILREAAGW